MNQHTDSRWTQVITAAALSGSAASIATTLVLACRGARERGDGPGPVNGPSQWIWGKPAAHKRGFSARYTVTGFLIHHAMSVLWAALFESLTRATTPSTPGKVLGIATATSALAYTVDFRLMPERLTPGFQKQLSRASLVLTYATFALALAASSLAARR